MWEMAAAAAAPLVAALVGEIFAAPDRAAAERLRQQAMEQYNISLPSLDELAAEQGASSFEQIQLDPRLREARMGALQRFAGLAEEGGMDAQAKAQLAEARQDAGQYEAGQRGALLSSMRSRGLGGSGLEMASALQAQQSGADRQAMGGIQAAADARQRALHALSQYGNMAGSIEGDAYRQAADKAQAQDAIARFNAANRGDAARDRFGMQQGLADRRANLYQSEADEKMSEAERKRKMWMDVGGGAQKVFGGMGGASK